MRDSTPGTQEFWASRKPTRSRGWNSKTPPMTMAISACCISIQWLATWRKKRFSPYSTFMCEYQAPVPSWKPHVTFSSSCSA